MNILYEKLNEIHIAILVKINAAILKNFNINKGILQNIDIDKAILENIDFNKEILILIEIFWYWYFSKFETEEQKDSAVIL